MPRPALPVSDCKSFDVPLTRSQEVEKIDPPVLTALRNAEKDEVFLDALLRGCSGDDLAKSGKCFYRVLSIVVVPRNSVIIEKSEKLVAVSLEPVLALYRRVTPEIGAVQKSKEPINLLSMLPQEISLESSTIDSFNNGLQQTPKADHY